jgi:hypothetical protein
VLYAATGADWANVFESAANRRYAFTYCSPGDGPGPPAPPVPCDDHCMPGCACPALTGPCVTSLGCLTHPQCDLGCMPADCRCPAGEACSVGQGCVPIPPPPPPECESSGFPACDGTCPAGQSCIPIAFPGLCMCL